MTRFVDEVEKFPVRSMIRSFFAALSLHSALSLILYPLMGFPVYSHLYCPAGFSYLTFGSHHRDLAF